MADSLTKHPFTADDWADVQAFDCGDEPFEQEVADWLRGPAEPGVESALNSIADETRQSRVWLYKLGDKLVGFGALAKTESRWPGENKDPRLPLSIIIWVGIQKGYRGQPPGPREGRFAAQILDDLVAEAEADARTRRPDQGRTRCCPSGRSRIWLRRQQLAYPADRTATKGA